MLKALFEKEYELERQILELKQYYAQHRKEEQEFFEGMVKTEEEREYLRLYLESISVKEAIKCKKLQNEISALEYEIFLRKLEEKEKNCSEEAKKQIKAQIESLKCAQKVSVCKNSLSYIQLEIAHVKLHKQLALFQRDNKVFGSVRSAEEVERTTKFFDHILRGKEIAVEELEIECANFTQSH